MAHIKTIVLGGYFYIVSRDELKNPTLDDFCGKWIVRIPERGTARQICMDAVMDDICLETKFTVNPVNNAYLCMFYCNCYEMERHEAILRYLYKNGVIPRTKAGRLYNISFKADAQTLAGEYGEDYKPFLTLEHFMDIDKEEWKGNEQE